jgi:hypothetical protein
LVLTGFLVGGCLWAGQPQHKVVSTYAEFIEGEFEGVSLTSDGKLILAPVLQEQLDTGEAFVHSAVLDQNGTLFLGTGNNGKIFRLIGAAGGEWTQLEEPGVHALAVDSSNRLYAATAPDGKVYQLDSNGKAETFFDPDEKYIWDLAIDVQNNLYVATGPRGIIYKVDSQGEGKPFYESDQIHVVELGWDLDKNLLAGSASEGLLLRISPAGKAFVLYDSPLEELKAITVDRYGNIYAAALSGKTRPNAAKTSSSSKKKHASSTEESTITMPGTAKGGRLEVYKIDRDNMVETLYTSNKELAFDLLIRSDGTLLVATGNRGRVLAVDSKRFTTLLVETGEEQVTELLESSESVFLATSNLGKVFKLSTQANEKGVYESEVYDAGVPAKWGTIRWLLANPSGPGVRLYTRSGNKKSPDRTWSDWEGPYTTSSGTQITSAPAQYIQWKVEYGPGSRTGALLTKTDAVELVSFSYLQHNLAPKLKSLTVHSPGVAFLKMASVNPAGGVPPGGPDQAHARSLPRSIRKLDTSRAATAPRKAFIPGARSFSWSASDPNDESLVFTLYLRPQGKNKWTQIAKELEETDYTIDGVSFPDGVYFLKVVASDKFSNPPGQALEHELVSDSFVIANSAPRVEWKTPAIAGRSVTVPFTASTPMCALYQIEYSLDGGRWHIIFPEDGITDGNEESFSIRLSDVAPGAHTVHVRVVDTVGNLGTHRQEIIVP